MYNPVVPGVQFGVNLTEGNIRLDRLRSVSTVNSTLWLHSARGNAYVQFDDVSPPATAAVRFNSTLSALCVRSPAYSGLECSTAQLNATTASVDVNSTASVPSCTTGHIVLCNSPFVCQNSSDFNLHVTTASGLTSVGYRQTGFQVQSISIPGTLGTCCAILHACSDDVLRSRQDCAGAARRC